MLPLLVVPFRGRKSLNHAFLVASHLFIWESLPEGEGGGYFSLLLPLLRSFYLQLSLPLLFAKFSSGRKSRPILQLGHSETLWSLTIVSRFCCRRLKSCRPRCCRCYRRRYRSCWRSCHDRRHSCCCCCYLPRCPSWSTGESNSWQTSQGTRSWVWWIPTADLQGRASECCVTSNLGQSCLAYTFSPLFWWSRQLKHLYNT